MAIYNMFTGNPLTIITLDRGKLLSGRIASRQNTVIYAAEMGTIILMNAGPMVCQSKVRIGSSWIYKT